ncbi:hypothetical protein LDENG_00135860 [Lucifuga dentata]|nr:hypothetical protein LDENG_00135860 [Lucifuga dentata]
MNSEQPPPYGFPAGPSAPGYPSGFNSRSPAPLYQSFPAQPYPSVDPSFPLYYECYQSGPPGAPYPWDGSKAGHMYGEMPKNTVFMVDESRREHSGGGRGLLNGVGGLKSCLAACSAALCCCFLWDCFT